MSKYWFIGQESSTIATTPEPILGQSLVGKGQRTEGGLLEYRTLRMRSLYVAANGTIVVVNVT
jgi:hypothetical protein